MKRNPVLGAPLARPPALEIPGWAVALVLRRKASSSPPAGR